MQYLSRHVFLITLLTLCSLAAFADPSATIPGGAAAPTGTPPPVVKADEPWGGPPVILPPTIWDTPAGKRLRKQIDAECTPIAVAHSATDADLQKACPKCVALVLKHRDVKSATCIEDNTRILLHHKNAPPGERGYDLEWNWLPSLDAHRKAGKICNAIEKKYKGNPSNSLKACQECAEAASKLREVRSAQCMENNFLVVIRYRHPPYEGLAPMRIEKSGQIHK